MTSSWNGSASTSIPTQPAPTSASTFATARGLRTHDGDAMSESSSPTSFPSLPGLPHPPSRCRDAEETRHFYEDVLELPLVVAVAHDRVPSTGDEHPYVHIFFQLRDGSMLA